MRRLLILDDDHDIRATMRMLFEEFGDYAIVEADNGLTGLKILRASQEPLVALVDLLLPRLDGLDMLQLVATDQQLAARHVYVIVTASRRDLHDRLLNLPLKVLVVRKPFDLSELLDVVSQADQYLSVEGASDRRKK